MARTVAFFMEHPDQLEATWGRCNNDPGSLRKDPDCINAAEARKQKLSREIDEALK
jgi:hypothetical protein